MSMGTLFGLAALVGVAVMGYKIWRQARRRAEEDGDDAGDPVAIAWQVFCMAAAVGIAFMAARGFIRSVPKGDHGFGGILYLIVAGVLLLVAFGLAQWGLGVAGRDRGPRQRLLIGAGVVGVLLVGLVWPMLNAARQDEAARAAQQAREQQQRLADLQKLKAATPHAPPGVTPPQLEVQREGNALHVTSRGENALQAQVQLARPQGAGYERCALGVEAVNCAPDAGSCIYRLAKDGTKVVDPFKVRNTLPTLKAGEKKIFTHNCDARFDNAQFEYSLYDIVAGKSVFRSESAFVPDAGR